MNQKYINFIPKQTWQNLRGQNLREHLFLFLKESRFPHNTTFLLKAPYAIHFQEMLRTSKFQLFCTFSVITYKTNSVTSSNRLSKILYIKNSLEQITRPINCKLLCHCIKSKNAEPFTLNYHKWWSSHEDSPNQQGGNSYSFMAGFI